MSEQFNNSLENITSKVNLLSETNHVAEAAFFTLLFIVALLMNFVVIISYFKTKCQTTHLKLLFNLCVINIIGSGITFLYGKGDEWLLKKNVCLPMLTIDIFWTILCLFSNILIITECLISTKQQYNNKSSETKFMNFRLTVILIWVCAGIVSMVTYMLLQRSADQNLCYMYQYYRQDLYSAFLYGFVIVPMLLLVSIEFWIHKIKRKHERTINAEKPEEENIQIDISNNKGTFVLSHLLLLNWLPYTVYIILLLNWGVNDIYFNEITYKMLKVLTFFKCMSCLLQPVSIVYFNRNINESFKRIYKKIEEELLGEEIKPVKKKKRLQRPNKKSSLTNIQPIKQPIKSSTSLSSAELETEM